MGIDESSMFVVDRRRGGTAECPVEDFTIAGTTGNVYDVQIGRVPKCSCPHARYGNQCKHIIHVRNLSAMLLLLPASASIASAVLTYR